MAFLRQSKSEDEIKKMTISGVKKAYNELASDYDRIVNLDVVYCPHCGEWKSRKNFYSNKNTASGLEHFACKACILDMCTDVDKQTKIRVDNKEKTIETFKKLNWYFNINDYNAQLQATEDGVNEKNRGTAVQTLIVMTSSLPQYRNKTFADSEFGVDDLENNSEEQIKINQKTLTSAKKRFGTSFSNEDLMFLENEYSDWVNRYQCDTKAQESIFERLSFKKWEINKATKSGMPTKDLDKTYQELLATANIQPRQNTMDAMSDAQTFGTLIQKYENERPLPEIDPELKDVDKIGLYIDAFYRGHASKMLGIKNSFSHLYEKIMSKYTVTPPEYDDETDSEVLFEKIFGTVED